MIDDFQTNDTTDALSLRDVKLIAGGEVKCGKISVEERAFALKLWRTRIRELRDLSERYGFRWELDNK